MTDLHTNASSGHDVPYGTGVSGIPSLLGEVKLQRCAGKISIEYEYNWTNNLPEIKQCIDFVRNNGG